MTNTQTDKFHIEGEISIHTENILPIIKKWLYSENEIFVRELLSNGFDATTKLATLKTRETFAHDPETPKLSIHIDETAKTITFSDNGLGMDASEIQKYINQIAFSGAEEFIQKYKDKDEKAQVIGHFGLGFYSSFIVSEKVEIHTLSYKDGAQPVRWTCDGSTHFSLEEGSRDKVGTDIILYVSKENKEYLNKARITTLVKKYANFLPVEITVDGEKANDQEPLWIKQPNDVTDEAYKAFYQKLFPFNPEPHFWIHLNVDYPFNLKGILYFPQIPKEWDPNKGKIHLYCQQVFVTEDAKDVVPEFLTLLQGVIDCPDIPLNVSRSYLQNDPYVQKISKHIVKKVADKLNDLFKKERASFETYWNDIHHFIKYGMLHHQEFYDKVKDIVVFESSNGGSTTLPEYQERNKEKLDKTILYCSDKETQAQYIDLCKEQDLEVIYLKTLIDSHFLQFLSSKNEDWKFVAVDTNLSDHLVETTEDATSDEQKAQSETILEMFKNALQNDKIKIEAKALKSEQTPALILEEEHVKKLKEMQAMMGGMGSFPMEDSYSLVVNTKNPLIQTLLAAYQAGNTERAALLCAHVYDLAMMNHQPLVGEKLQAFIKRSMQVMSALG